MPYNTQRPLALVILDGWGISREKERNAIALAHTPNYDQICARFPSAGLRTSTSASSNENWSAEIGHRTIGAGRLVQGDAARIRDSVTSGEFARNPLLLSAFSGARDLGRPIHLVGLLGDGGVHSAQETLFALLRLAKLAGVPQVFVHGILDGRDVPTRTADIYVEALEIKMADIGIGRIASLCGRFYAMDSSEHWERTARAYTMMVLGEGERSPDAVTAIRASFLRGISDEFISPVVIETGPDQPAARIGEGDCVVFFNHKGEAMRQLVRSLAVPDPASPKPRVNALTLTEYEPAFGLPAAFGQHTGGNLLADLFTEHEVRNYRITESSRSAHVSTFLNGRPADASELERRIFFPTPGPETLETEPESKSFEIADTVIRGLEMAGSGVFVINFPAAAAAAESRDLQKTIEAVQFIDTCLGGIVDSVVEMDGIALVTSSHTGCEHVLQAGAPDGTWRFNEVPFHYIDTQSPPRQIVGDGTLQDVAPTILGSLGIEKPAEMTGRDLRMH